MTFEPVQTPSQPVEAQRYVQGGTPALSNLAGAEYAPLEDGIGPAQYEEGWIGRTGLKWWRWTVYDLRQGLGKTQGDLLRDHARLYSGEIDIRGQEQACLPPLTTLQAEANIVAAADASFTWCNVYDRLVIAMGEANGYALWKETSLTDPTLIRLSGYNPGGSIFYITPIIINSGTTPTPRLAVFRSGGNPQILDDIGTTPTINGTTMHANLNSVTGLIQTTIQTGPGDAVILMIAGPALYRLKASDAIGATPTLVTVLPAGGVAHGLLDWGGQLRALWGITKEGGVLTKRFGLEEKHMLLSTNQIGSQPEEIETPFPGGYYNLVFWEGQIVLHDETQVYKMAYPKRWVNLNIFGDRAPNSLRKRFIRNLSVHGPHLIARVDEYPSSGSVATTSYDLAYNKWLQAWQPLRPARTITGLTTPQSQMSMNMGMPHSEQTHYVHGYTSGDETFDRYYPLEYGETPYGVRSTSGSTGKPYVSSAPFRLPTMRFPGSAVNWGKKITKMGLVPPASLSGGRAVATGSAFSGTVGGENANEQITYGQSWSADNWPYNKPPYQVWRENRTLFRALSLSGTVYQGSDAQLTPQILPFFIEGVMGADDARVREYVYHG